MSASEKGSGSCRALLAQSDSSIQTGWTKTWDRAHEADLLPTEVASHAHTSALARGAAPVFGCLRVLQKKIGRVSFEQPRKPLARVPTAHRYWLELGGIKVPRRLTAPRTSSARAVSVTMLERTACKGS
jgi:hypothetical protein